MSNGIASILVRTWQNVAESLHTQNWGNLTCGTLYTDRGHPHFRGRRTRSQREDTSKQQLDSKASRESCASMWLSGASYTYVYTRPLHSGNKMPSSSRCLSGEEGQPCAARRRSTGPTYRWPAFPRARFVLEAQSLRPGWHS